MKLNIYVKLVGDGRSIRVWDDPWLSLDSPTRPMGPATEGTASMLVREPINEETGEWNRELLHTILPFEEDRILRLKPSSIGAPDRLKWLGTKHGDYTVKSGYHTAMKETTEEILEHEATPEFDWKKTVWNLKLGPKIKMFTWKCLKGILPVGERLVERHINVDPKCKRCGSSESINHLLFHCPFARDVWKLSPLDASFEISRLTDLRADWSQLHGQKCLPPTGVASTPLAPWIMWSLWKGRNKFMFENYAGNPVDILTQAIVAAKEWESAQIKEEKKSQTTALQPLPLVPSVTRSDAAWNEESQCAGLGWVVMTAEQRHVGKKRMLCTSSALIAEAMAMREAMQMSRNLGIREVRFESDSARLIKAINLKKPELEIYGIVEDILNISFSFDVVIFSWIPRERNGEADCIAKQALASVEQVVVEAVFMPPPN